MGLELLIEYELKRDAVMGAVKAYDDVKSRMVNALDTSNGTRSTDTTTVVGENPVGIASNGAVVFTAKAPKTVRETIDGYAKGERFTAKDLVERLASVTTKKAIYASIGYELNKTKTIKSISRGVYIKK